MWAGGVEVPDGGDLVWATPRLLRGCSGEAVPCQGLCNSTQRTPPHRDEGLSGYPTAPEHNPSP